MVDMDTLDMDTLDMDMVDMDMVDMKYVVIGVVDINMVDMDQDQGSGSFLVPSSLAPSPPRQATQPLPLMDPTTMSPFPLSH